MTTPGNEAQDSTVKFGKDLREKLRKECFTANAASRAIGVAQSTMSQWLNGTRLMSRDDLIKLVDLFDGDKEQWLERWEPLDADRREKIATSRTSAGPRAGSLEAKIMEAFAGMPSGTVVRVNFEFIVP